MTCPADNATDKEGVVTKDQRSCVPGDMVLVKLVMPVPGHFFR